MLRRRQTQLQNWTALLASGEWCIGGILLPENAQETCFTAYFAQEASYHNGNSVYGQGLPKIRFICGQFLPLDMHLITGQEKDVATAETDHGQEACPRTDSYEGKVFMHLIKGQGKKRKKRLRC